MNIVVIDNHDSFTFNLVYDLRALGCTVEAWRNDVPLEPLLERAVALSAPVVLSPGPGAPADAGICVELVRAARGRFGVLGICLGHQAIVEAFGGTVRRAKAPVHGRATAVHLSPHALFEGLPPRAGFARYHSLAAGSVPDVLQVVATAADDTVMAVAHREQRIAGLQFHPESILSGAGRTVLRNALAWIGGDHARVA
jgi:anthranilate synthase component II